MLSTSRSHRLFGITIRQAYQYYSTNINDTVFRKSLVRYYSIHNTLPLLRVCFELLGWYHLVSSLLLEYVRLPELNTVILQLARLIESPFWRIHGLFFYSATDWIRRSRTSRTLVRLRFLFREIWLEVGCFCRRSIKV
jgi:hypothetical protein